MNEGIGQYDTRSQLVKSDERPSQVKVLLDEQLKCIQSLGGLLGTLEDRVRCVSRSEPEQPVNEKLAATVSNSIMETIREHNSYIEKSCNRIQNMLRLLEV